VLWITKVGGVFNQRDERLRAVHSMIESKNFRGFEGIRNLLASDFAVNKIQLADLARGWPKLIEVALP
jgi:hypothetical protein